MQRSAIPFSRPLVSEALPHNDHLVNMICWIRHPRQVDKLTAMPERNVTPEDAQDTSSYLYTLRRAVGSWLATTPELRRQYNE